MEQRNTSSLTSRQIILNERNEIEHVWYTASIVMTTVRWLGKEGS